MKILSLSNCPLDPVLGSGKAVIRYTEGLRSLGYAVDVYGPEHFEFMNWIHRGSQYRMAVGASRFLQTELRNKRYDLIEFYGAEFWLAARTLYKQGIRPLMVMHTNGYEYLAAEMERKFVINLSLKDILSRKLSGYIFRDAFKCTDRFVCMCEPDRGLALEHGFYRDAETAIIRHGIDEVFLERNFMTNRERSVAYLGSWIPRKDIGTIVAVMTRVLFNDSGIRFNIFGAGSAKDRIISAFPEKVIPQIKVYGRLPDRELSAELSRSSVFFFPSWYEGFGLAITEAMASGCAVVTTPTGFGAELICGENAIVCDFGDVDGMAAAIERLFENDAERERIARNGWGLAQGMTWNAACQRLADVYQQWVSEYTDIQH